MQATTKQDQVKALKEEINLKIKLNSKIQSEVKSLIMENEAFVQESKKEDKPYARIVGNLYSAALKKFEKAGNLFQTEQTSIQDFLKIGLLRDAEIAMNKKLSPEEQKQFLDNPDMIQEIKESKLSGKAHTQLSNKVSDLSDRHTEILNLEKSVNDMHQLFLDLAGLVEHQGQIIDNIEMNVSQAKECTLQAEKDVIKSHAYMKSARKKRWIVIGIIVVVLVIVCATVLPVSL